jgi:hypothetical protein
VRNITLAVRVVVIVAVFGFSAVGQQQSTTVLAYPDTRIDLAIEPARAQIDPSIALAAQRNDFPGFEKMFTRATASEVAVFGQVYTFWKWSLTNPIGAFYGSDLHAKFAAQYPDYAAYIADFEIIDSHGNAFYPSAETRKFLLQHALAGVVPAQREVPRVATATAPASKPGVRQLAAATIGSTSKPAQSITLVAVKKPAPVAVEKPAPVIVEKAAPIVEAPIARPLPTPRVAVQSVKVTPAPAIEPIAPLPQPKIMDGRLGRGLALVVAGLIAVGMLSLMLKAPADDEPLSGDTGDAMRIIKLDANAESDHGSHSSVA